MRTLIAIFCLLVSLSARAEIIVESPGFILPEPSFEAGEIFSFSFGPEDMHYNRDAADLSFGDTSFGVGFQSITAFSFDIRIFEDAGDVTPFTERHWEFTHDDGNPIGVVHMLSDDHWADLDGYVEIEMITGSLHISSTYATAVQDGIVYSTIPPSAVPVPAAIWLFTSGALFLAGVARRRQIAE